MNLGTITDTLSWYKFSPLSGIRVKTKLHKRRRRIYERSYSRRRSQKLFIRTIYYNLESIVKNYHGIIEQQLHFINQTQAESQNEMYVEQKKRHRIDRGEFGNDCGFGIIGKVGRIRNSSSKNQRERSIDITKRR